MPDESRSVDRGFLLGASDGREQVLSASVPITGFVVYLTTELPTRPRRSASHSVGQFAFRGGDLCGGAPLEVGERALST